jgi:hypothetical protein
VIAQSGKASAGLCSLIVDDKTLRFLSIFFPFGNKNSAKNRVTEHDVFLLNCKKNIKRFVPYYRYNGEDSIIVAS